MKKLIMFLLVAAMAVPSSYAWFDSGGAPSKDQANGVSLKSNGIEFEGATADAYETTIQPTDPTADRTITIPDASGTIQLSGNAISGTTVTSSGSILSTSTTDIGWSIVTGANTACNTTCTNGCVFGQNTADETIVSCSATTADVCVCAGAS